MTLTNCENINKIHHIKEDIMSLTAEYLQKEEEQIAEDIYIFCQEMLSDEKQPIYDGVINVEKYVNNETYRICWVLKETYDKKDGDWYLSDFLGNKERWREYTKQPTWKRVIFTTYGIINDFTEYSDMDDIKGDPEMVQCLNYISVINVNKMPAKSESKDVDIAQKYIHFKPLLYRQLEKYDPQIIIFGNTFQHFQNDLGINDEELSNYYKDKEKPRYVVKNGKLYIDTYHPAVRPTTMIEDDYVQSIIDIVKINKNNLNE